MSTKPEKINRSFDISKFWKKSRLNLIVYPQEKRGMAARNFNVISPLKTLGNYSPYFTFAEYMIELKKQLFHRAIWWILHDNIHFQLMLKNSSKIVLYHSQFHAWIFIFYEKNISRPNFWLNTLFGQFKIQKLRHKCKMTSYRFIVLEKLHIGVKTNDKIFKACIL